MGVIKNAEKGKHVSLTVPGLEFESLYLIQTFDVPERTVEAIEHREGGRTAYTAGNISVDDFTIKVLKAIGNASVDFFWNKQSEFFLGLESGNFDCTVTSTVSGVWYLEQCVVEGFKAFDNEIDKSSSDNIMASFRLKVSDIRRAELPSVKLPI